MDGRQPLVPRHGSDLQSLDDAAIDQVLVDDLDPARRAEMARRLSGQTRGKIDDD